MSLIRLWWRYFRLSKIAFFGWSTHVFTTLWQRSHQFCHWSWWPMLRQRCSNKTGIKRALDPKGWTLVVSGINRPMPWSNQLCQNFSFCSVCGTNVATTLWQREWDMTKTKNRYQILRTIYFSANALGEALAQICLGVLLGCFHYGLSTFESTLSQHCTNVCAIYVDLI